MLNIFSRALQNNKGFNEINLQSEINTINKEIESLLSGKEVSITDSKIIKRINVCIRILTEASKVLKAQENFKRKQQQYKESLDKKNDKTLQKKITQDFQKAGKALDKIKQSVSKKYNRKEIRLAIAEGYIIVTQIREQLNETIDYKIMSVGYDGEKAVLFESQPTLAQVLSATQFDSSSFALKLEMTASQFNTILKMSQDTDKISKVKNSVLAQMKRVTLTTEQENMWNVFLETKKSLDNIQGAMLNYGQLVESFEEYLICSKEDPQMEEIDYIYSLLEKGRNNLAYYLGADVDKYQIKTLSTLGSIGRADVALLTNVLNPLTQIKEKIVEFNTNPNLLKNYFQKTSKTQGDRPFEKELESIIKEEIRKVVQNNLTS